ncbi:RecBCD enzyme subunit RecB [Rhodococcoides trifolii]|uniref:RecBCD enzyme subunit RecB n=1 Tax=Rhodococcoides trifolii TaxID=908250 RepID=A0A917FQP8_9NOCA|nr:UvrD-helicase domain-containing protein [Rhodococcus trifolii]GGG00178.1 RecBCD enzyme subunit RecB [Rhodococcus trifolii]
MNFDLTAPLPTGTTVLEASAGTGKTYAIVGLATRFVAEGVADVSQLLLVTFSKTATQELRDRTRSRFASVSTALADIETARTHADEVVRCLADTDPAEVELRRRRLTKALSDFDSGTIATTHSFCQRMLDGLGIGGEREPDSVFVEDLDDLVAEVADDLYLRTYSRSDAPATIEPKEARSVAMAAVGDRQAILVPEENEDSVAGHRVIFARKARAEVERRKRVLGVRDYDDLLQMLRDVIVDPNHGDAACARISNRFRVVLVDEFQDTDPLQWEILEHAFHRSSTLVLVGDPKQAIYAFRGAEVLSYLEASRIADSHQELTTNWRSDKPLLDALEHVYQGAALGHDDIVVHHVDANHPESRIPSVVPLRVRYLPRTGMGPLNRSGFPTVGPVRERVAEDVAADIVELLTSATTVELHGESRPVAPGDVAVLLRTWRQVGLVRDALDRAGVPSVLAGGTSVFATAGATDWLWVLQALEQPHRSDRVRLAALTPLLGWTAADLDSRGDDAVAAVSNQLRNLSMLFAQAGFAAVFERMSWEAHLESRLLALDAGERHLTDLRHIAQLLNKAAVEESFGLTALTRWLTDRVKDPSGGPADRSRRLDSDAAAVQVATIHATKGLEFPIVYVPYVWDAFSMYEPASLLLHEDDGRRVLDVGGSTGPGYSGRKSMHDTEQAGEELRLFYVALTRAQCAVTMWWAPSWGTRDSPAHRLLFGRLPGVRTPEPKPKVPADDIVQSHLENWAGDGPDGAISVEFVDTRAVPEAHWAPTASQTGSLAAARFDRILDMAWRRTSYSALTASAHETPGVGSETEREEKTDEPDGEPPVEDVLTGIPSPMNGMPAGAAFGTLVHEVLEHVDTGVEDLNAEVVRRCREAVASRLADVDPEALAAALIPVLHTPLGFGTLADIGPADRLAELDFELPLVGGDDPETELVTVKNIAALVRSHLPADDVLAPYADMLDTLAAVPLRGYLTGSIDSVLRVDGERFVIVDYKTNRISRGDLTVAHFSRERMAGEMMRSHYPLQALLYSVALHRYLRWRLPGYRADRHLGGAQYHFVRGMVGPETPAGCGVFDWNPPAALVSELSDLLAGVGA